MDERDAIAKSKASAGQSSANKPGAQAVKKDEATELDERIASKQKGVAAKCAPTSRRQMNEFEADIAAKGVSRAFAPAVAPGVTSVSNDEASRMDARIAAKTSRGTAALVAPTRSSSLRQNEPESTGFSRPNSRLHVAPGARAECARMEEEIAAKTRGMKGDSYCPANGADGANMAQLDDRIDAKIRGSPSRVVKEDPREEPTKWNDLDVNQHCKRDDEEDVKEDSDEKALIDEKGGHVGLECAPPIVTNAHGMINEPDVEFGTSGGRGHGYIDEGLAVAIAVAEEEEEAFIPAAIQYDPDAKPPLYKNRRARLYAFMGCMTLVVATVGVAVFVTSSAHEEKPTLAPTTYRDSLGIQAQIAAVVGENALADPTSPQSLAMEWIINEDPAVLEPTAINLIQRYILSLFYISTTQSTPWLSCNRPAEGEESACMFKKLVQTYPNETYEDVPWYRWLSAENECDWAGIYCDEYNQTRAMELPGQQIRGTLPADLANMPYLQSITINWNELYGTLPSQFGEMKHLLNVEMHYNFFTGDVPLSWYNAQALQRLNLAGNLLSGKIPTEIGSLSTMKGYFNFENMMIGSIPTEMGNMKFLSFTRMARNLMTGSIPTEIGQLSKLQEMWFHRNLYTGTLPSEMGDLRDISDIRLHFNQMTGTIPDEIYGLPQLTRFDMYNCNLTGTISPKIGAMSNLDVFRVRNNILSGTIPSEVGNVTGLSELWLHLNHFTGSMPKEVCARRGSLGITTLRADCRSDSIGFEPVIDCQEGCCTYCCDSISGVCQDE